jgi:site-specific recombinase XerD
MKNKMSSLQAQVERIHRHARQGSIGTRREYRKCMLRFVAWLDLNCNLQNMRNINNKHLANYIQYLLHKGNMPGYVIKNLSAIRYYHDQLFDPRYTLERENAKLGVPPRVPPGDRAWTSEEYQLLCEMAVASGVEWIADVLMIQRELGLRIHESVRLYKIDAERAFANGNLRVKGKGGKVRQTIPLTPLSEQALKRAAARVRRGARLFVPEGEKAHTIIKHVQDFILANRPQREGEQLTSHGLRYSYAQDRMAELDAAGVPEEKAELRVAQEMGHNRRRVTRGYTRKQ